MWELILAVLALLIASAICSGTEAAIFSLPIAKARQLAEKSNTGKVVRLIRENPARPISTVVVFNNLANIVGTYFVAYLATKVLTGYYLTLFPFCLTILVIVLSEILPKTIGERFCVNIIWIAARPVAFLTILLTPLVWMAEVLTDLVVGKRSQVLTSEHEIKALVKIGHQEGVIDDDESQMIGKIFELDDVTAEKIMTPRTAITWIRNTTPISVAKEKIGNSQHSRILVVGETIDDVKGIILKSTMLRLIVEDHDDNDPVGNHVENVKLIGKDTPADKLLDFFKKSRIHLAVVVDEYSGVCGLVTLEDVLEVLTGEIVDETDIDVDMREFARKNGAKRMESHGL